MITIPFYFFQTLLHCSVIIILYYYLAKSTPFIISNVSIVDVQFYNSVTSDLLLYRRVNDRRSFYDIAILITVPIKLPLWTKMAPIEVDSKQYWKQYPYPSMNYLLTIRAHHKIEPRKYREMNYSQMWRVKTISITFILKRLRCLAI